MKKVISGKELSDKIEEGIDLLCNTVKQTLGPKGNNVIIDHSNFVPFITNDGVTIAQNIESDDPILGSIIEIAKESSIKTNDNVGDGTTTTLVLMQSLIHFGYKAIEKGISPILLKKKLNTVLNFILDKLVEMKKSTNEEMLKDIASISANDEQIGTLVGEVVSVVDNKSAIMIKEEFKETLVVEYMKGYSCLISHPSEYYFQEKRSFQLQNAYVLIVNDVLMDIENISSILNEAIMNKKSLIMIAKDFDASLVNEIIALNFENQIQCIMMRINEYGLRERIIEKDLEIITGASIVENALHISGKNIGIVKNVYIDKETMRMDFTENEKIEEYVKQMENSKTTISDYEFDFYQKRKAMFTNGIAEITIGAPTKAESHEKRMRLEDAICSSFASKNGYLFGGGVTLLKIADQLDSNTDEMVIWKEALKQPFRQIMQNAGLSATEIEENIKKHHYSKVYNVYSDCYEDCGTTKIIDAFDVVYNALVNACSIAVMLLTTNSLIINEHQDSMNKSGEYTEI